MPLKKEVPKPLSKKELKTLLYELQALKEDGIEINKPDIRESCPKERPCAYVSCVYNTYLDVDNNGNILFNQGSLEPWEVNPKTSCVLDIADRIEEGFFYNKRSKGLSNKEIGDLLGGISRESIRLIELSARKRIAFLYNIDEDSMNVYEEIRFTEDELKRDLGIKKVSFNKWIRNGLAFTQVDGKYVITLEALHDFFRCNYREYYVLNITEEIRDKYKLKILDGVE